MKPDKTYAKFYELKAEYIEIGRKFDGCECIVFSKDGDTITVELCDYHTKSVKEGSVKYIHPLQEPTYPENTIGKKCLP